MWMILYMIQGYAPPIESYDPNIRDDFRMSYLEKGPCQPYGRDFPRKLMENDNKCFQKEWLTVVIDCTRLLLMQGLSFCGHDESKESLNGGNLIELLNWYVARCKEIKEVLFSNAPENDQMTSPTIQKNLVNCCDIETTRAIINETRDSLFSILVDEARDNSMKEQMTVVLRFIDKSGQVKELFWDVINAMFSTHGLSISSLRGQDYNRASNMSGEFNGLKALILRENPRAMYVHCFAHQLQLTIVSVARRNCMLGDFFDILAIIVNLLGTSCKRVDALRINYQTNILEKLNIGKLTGGSRQFQEMSLARPDNTRYVLENISEDGVHSDKNSSTNMKENGWDTLLSRVIEFCVDRHILVPNMEDTVVVKDRPRRVAQQDFNSEEFLLLRHQLDKFLLLVRMDETFFNLNSISCVAQKLVETRSSCYFPLVYRLLTLALILRVATASIERVFSAII
ncbi:uncharacterized protein LOC111366946 [Olea europaea var. sylvestris]|uniref:uncharacterized protein LOC111366946 n=1 Tax=Olea europaea var. sylvestris TaxID=158386 RepID=UPI000C1CEC6F|nr:uncharacterized protein LOC111366946 [Olea europaea var. sylvestris]